MSIPQPPAGVYSPEPARDVTAVMGRRFAAWLVDGIIYLAIILGSFAALAEYVEVPPGLDDVCDRLQTSGGDEVGNCFFVNDRAYVLSSGDSAVQTGLSLGYFVFFVVVQGVAGGSPGKLLLGLRVVDKQGAKAGVGRSLGRSLLWIVDAAPWFVPLVGPITALTSSGHRRIGDMAAGTHVVAARDVGMPVSGDAVGPPPGQSAWGAPPPAPGWGPPGASGTPGAGTPAAPPAPSWAPPTAPSPAPPTSTDPTWAPPSIPSQYDAPSPSDASRPLVDTPDEAATAPDEVAGAVDFSPPEVDPDPEWSRTPDLSVEPPPEVREIDDAADRTQQISGWSPPATPAAERVDEPGQAAPWEPPSTPFSVPGAEQPPTTPSAADEPARDQPVVHELPPPQWDQARNTYIQWDPNRSAWLQWDAAANRWKDIDT